MLKNAKDLEPKPGQYMVWVQGSAALRPSKHPQRLRRVFIAERKRHGYLVRSDSDFHTVQPENLFWPDSVREWLDQSFGLSQRR